MLADGQLQRVSARRIVYSAETAHLYERASKLETPVVGGLALSPIVVEGWATYNFEVEIYTPTWLVASAFTTPLIRGHMSPPRKRRMSP